jgi:hypothetical protein
MLGVFEATTGGDTDVFEPTWRTGLDGSAITDGTVVWHYISQLDRIPFAMVGPIVINIDAGEAQAGPRATVNGDGVADSAQRATVVGDGTATASLSGYAGTGSVDVDSSGTVAGDGNVDASSAGTVGGDGGVNTRSDAIVEGDGDADTYQTAWVKVPVAGTATSGFRSRVNADDIVGVMALADASGLAIEITFDTISFREFAGTADPSAGAGVTANILSTYRRDNTGTGELWFKTGAADTDWTQVV